MEWVHERTVRDTVGWFVGRTVPDADPDWNQYPYAIEWMGRDLDGGAWWLVTYDIGTSVPGMDCWLSFRVVEPAGGRDAYVEGVHAVRSGRGEYEGNVYVWDDREDMWVTAPNDDDE